VNSLAVVGIGLLGVLVGIMIGARIASHNIAKALRHAPHVIDLRPNGNGSP
jgi:uncharacterized protein YneF (UPF0154 family)